MINPRHPVLIKKYGNRRLYDTEESRYITLEELAAKIQAGTDVRVVEAKGGEDLTQATLTQLVIEGRNVAKLLPVPLLLQLIRLGDDALAEFFGRYVTSALEMYLQAKRGVQTVASYNPLAAMPFAATNALARMWMQSPFAGGAQHAPPAYNPPPSHVTPPPGFGEPEPPAPPPESDVAALRRELDELKQSMREANQGSNRSSETSRSNASRARRRPPRKKRS